MMQISWKRFIVNMLPISLRTETVYGLLKAALAPLISLYNSLLDYNVDVDYKLKHTSQAWSIKAVLNDTFDIDERRIFITDSGGTEVILLDLDSYEAPILLDTDAYPPAVIIYPDSDYNGSEFDFIINIPFELSVSELFRLKALVDFYKLAGKRYDIIIN